MGFIVDAGVLTVMMRLVGWSALPSRVISFAVAVTVTWLINRRYTFSEGSSLSTTGEYASYLAIQTSGAAINFGIFLLCLKQWPQLSAWPVVPLAAGSAVALLFNFTLSRAIVYPGRTDTPRSEAR